MLRRIAIFAYGIASYALGMAAILYIMGFLGNVGVPRGIDGAPTSPFAIALVIDIALVAFFGLQHSVMARAPFKRWLTRWIPVEAERSTYVLASALALVPLFAFWQPLGGVVWDVSSEVGRAVIHGILLTGWVLLVFSTFLIDHFELFGLRQASAPLFGRTHTPPAFKTPLLYRHVRHPLYVGWLLGIWAAPTMTLTHLLFALATTAYILVAIRFEERDLVAAHGAAYERYRESVPMLVPGWKSAASAKTGIGVQGTSL